MALFRRPGVAQAFRNNRQLQQFVLTGVTPTGRVLGTGSYGSVEEVTYKHLTCAAKKLHEILIEAGNDGVDGVVRKYLLECQLMSSLRHPNITQFLGLCYLPGTQLPLLVMERLEMSLDELLEHVPGLPISLKRSVLEDVASGLLYLHDRPSPVIHRDLTASNVLLTSSLTAKISDMGNSRIIDMRGGRMARTLSQLPGTLVYMPPEALDDRHRYGPSLDVFSYGHLALFTLIQKFPSDLLPSTFPNPDNLEDVRGRTEVGRRERYIEMLEGRISAHPALIQLVKQCLHNVPDQRPSTDELLATLQRMKVEVEGEYGGSPIRLDMVRVRLAKEVKSNEQRIRELTQQQIRHGAELQEMAREAEERDRHVQDLQAEILTKDGHIQQKDQQLQQNNQQLQQKDQDIEQKMQQIQGKENVIVIKDEQIQHLQSSIQTLETQMEELRADLQLRETRLREELQSKETEISRLREKEKKVPLEFPHHLKQRCGPDMPFGMSGYVQSVVVQGTVYIGGGYAGRGSGKNYIIMAFDITSGKWTTLPPYRTINFAMTAINNQLVLVGGVDHGDASRVLGVWGADNKQWTHPYPVMHTGRSECSAVVYNEWLVVAGGVTGGEHLSSVEVMNIDSKQWFIGPPTPAPWQRMKTATVGDVCYFMGGFTTSYNTNMVYSVSLSALTTGLNSNNASTSERQIWMDISGLQTTSSSPLSISGSLFAVCGIDKYNISVTAIHLYQPGAGEWVKVGDLPAQPRYNCTCAMITDWEMLVAGGYYNVSCLRRMDIAMIKC